MSEETRVALIDATDKLDAESNNIVNDLVETKDPQQIQDLTALFNITNTKKNALRIMRLGELWDASSSELLKRVAEHPDMHSNDDLVKYLSIAESGMDRAAKTLGNVDVTPMIQINQQNNTVNINNDNELSRDDRLKVMDVVSNILKKVKTDQLFDTTTDLTKDSIVLNNEENKTGDSDASTR